MNISDLLLDLLNKRNLGELAFTDIRFGSDEPVIIKTPRGWKEAPDIVDYPNMVDMQNFVEGIEPNYEGLILNGGINRPLRLQSVRLRINAYLAMGGEQMKCSIRPIALKPPELDTLGLPKNVRLLLENNSGIILFVGSTGSGKTTSLASMVDSINKVRNRNIMTIEDPIEYVYTPDKSFFSQREVGVDCESFYVGVKDAMRQAPDVIVLGEIRDRETAEQALIAGESGHLVLGTLHANSALGGITKMMNLLGSSDRETKMQSLASSLVGIVHQTLLPRKDESGVALAVDFICNHRRQYSRFLNEPDKLEQLIYNNEDKMSLSLADSLTALIKNNIINKADAARLVMNNTKVHDAIKGL